MFPLFMATRMLAGIVAVSCLRNYATARAFPSVYGFNVKAGRDAKSGACTRL